MESEKNNLSAVGGYVILAILFICSVLIARGMTLVLYLLFLWQSVGLIKSRGQHVPDLKIMITSIPILVWMCLSYFWAHDQDDACQRLIKTIPVLITGLLSITYRPKLFFHNTKIFQTITTITIATSCLIATLIYFFVFENSQLHASLSGIKITMADLQRNSMLIGCVFFTLLMARGLLCFKIQAILLPIVLYLLLLFPNDTAILALISAASVYLLSFISFQVAYRLFQISLIVLPVAFLVFALNMHDFGVPHIHNIYSPDIPRPPFISIIHRFYIWHFVSEYILQSPLIGWGIDASRHIPGGQDLVVDFNSNFQYLPLHPHNAILHILFELGIIGYLCLLGPLFLILHHISHMPNGYHQRLSLTVLSYICINLMGSYGVWQSWLLSGIFVFTALWRCLILSHHTQSEHQNVL